MSTPSVILVVAKYRLGSFMARICDFMEKKHVYALMILTLKPNTFQRLCKLFLNGSRLTCLTSGNILRKHTVFWFGKVVV